MSYALNGYAVKYPYRSVYGQYPGFLGMGAVTAAVRDLWKDYNRDLTALEANLRKGTLPPDAPEPPRPDVPGTRLQVNNADATIRKLPTARTIAANLYAASAARTETGFYSRGVVPPTTVFTPQPAPAPPVYSVQPITPSPFPQTSTPIPEGAVFPPSPIVTLPAGPSAGPVVEIPGLLPIAAPPEPIQSIGFLPATSRRGLVVAGVAVVALLGAWALVRRRRKNPGRRRRARRR